MLSLIWRKNMSKYYKEYNFFDISKEKEDFSNLTILNHFKTMQQSYENTCASACAIMLLNYYNDNRFSEQDELKLTKFLKTKPFPIGTELSSFVKFFKTISSSEHNYIVVSSIDYKKDKNGLCFSTFEDFKEFVLDNLKNGYPIIVENVDYGGHYKIIIGYDCVNDNSDEDILIFADPSDLNDGNKDGYYIYPADRFYYMWFDDHCFKKKHRKQPFIVVKK